VDLDAPMAFAKNRVLFESLCYVSVDIVAYHTVLFFPFLILVRLIVSLQFAIREAVRTEF